MKETDILRRFIFENIPVRGVIVHMDAAWRAVRERSDYPVVVENTLGQFATASVLLSSTLKFDGSMTLQIQGDGPIGLMVAEATAARTVRAVARWKGEVADDPGLQALFGNGNLVITIDLANEERYQGIVALEGENVASVVEGYLQQSEQLDTRLWLAIDGEQATGMLLQKLPGEEADDTDAWNRISQLAATIKDDELKGLSAEEILHRLFHEDDLRLFDAEPVSFRCSCSRERVGNMLLSLGADEVHSIIEDEGKIDVNCQFCNQLYSFDAVDAEEVLAANISPDVPNTRH